MFLYCFLNVNIHCCASLYTHSDSGITHTFPQVIDSYTNKQDSKPASHQSETGVTYQFYTSLGAATSTTQIKCNWIWPILNWKKGGVCMLTNHLFISVSVKSSSFLKSPQTSWSADHRRMVTGNGVGGHQTLLTVQSKRLMSKVQDHL